MSTVAFQEFEADARAQGFDDELGRLAWSDVVAQHVRGARIVKIANTLPPSLIHHRLRHMLN